MLICSFSIECGFMWWLASVALVCLSPSSFYSLCVCGVRYVAVMLVCLGDCWFRAARVKSRMCFVVQLQAVCQVSCAVGWSRNSPYLGLSCLSGFHLPSLNSPRNRENKMSLKNPHEIYVCQHREYQNLSGSNH